LKLTIWPRQFASQDVVAVENVPVADTIRPAPAMQLLVVAEPTVKSFCSVNEFVQPEKLPAQLLISPTIRSASLCVVVTLPDAGEALLPEEDPVWSSGLMMAFPLYSNICNASRPLVP
jgi:hypothetical protein